jgi:cyclase
MQDLGAGEIVLNSVDRDGQLQGYDLDLVERVRQAISVPLTVLGGAGSLDDIRLLVQRHPVIGAAAGSLFVFKGKYRAVLINYPERTERDALARPAETEAT